MVEDAPDDLVHEMFSQRFWARHPLGRPILGTAETISAFSPEGLRDYFSRTYVASNVVIAAAGHLEHEQLRDMVARALWRPSGAEAERCTEPPAVTPGLFERRKDIEQSHLCVGTPAYPQAHTDRHAVYVLNTILGGSMSSRLFQHIREERGLAYAVFSNLTTYSDAGTITVYAGCANDKVSEVIELTLAELRQLREETGAGRGDPAGEGPPEGQPHAQSREHLEPHGAFGAAGAVFRPALHARRDPRQHRSRHRRRRPAGGGGSVLRLRPRGHRGRAEGRQPADGRTAENHRFMIARYTHPDMGAIWSDARRYDTWLEVELAATDALAASGVVPEADARTLRERASFDIARIDEIERTTQHDVIAFTTAVAERVGPAARWLHFGLTSSDVLDTALGLQMRAGLRSDPRRTSTRCCRRFARAPRSIASRR